MRRWILRLGLLGVAAALIPACGSSSGGGSGVLGSGGAGAVSVSNLVSASMGGTGFFNDGGWGGRFDVEGNTGSDVRILTSGTVNSVVSPLVLRPDLGWNPRVVSVSQTWDQTNGLNPDGSGRFSGADTDNDATGLWIMPGVTLTIIPDQSNYEVTLRVDNSMYIEGTLKIGRGDDGQDTDTADLQLSVNQNLVITSTGVVDVSGEDGPTSGDAGRGGDLIVNWANSWTVVNAGLIDTSGGNGGQGGAGGDVQIIADNGALYNSGTINTSGGNGSSEAPALIASVSNPFYVIEAGDYFTTVTLESTVPSWITANMNIQIVDCSEPNNNGNWYVQSISGSQLTLWTGNATVQELNSPGIIIFNGNLGEGGWAGDIQLESNTDGNFPGGVFNTGNLFARGGSGAANGRSGGNVDVEAGEGGVGAFTSSGIIDTSGGHTLNAAYDEDGGDGGSIWVDAAGTIRITGQLITRGGNSAGTDNNSWGGDGGDIDLESFDDDAISDSSMGGGIALGATIDTSGGSGFGGGDAGDVDVYAEVTDNSNALSPGQDIIWIVGYNQINTSGGNGKTSGGSAGDVEVTNSSVSSSGVDYYGSIRNEAAIVARGGDGELEEAGHGGDLAFTTESGGLNTNRSVTNTGSIDLRGGSGELMDNWDGAGGDAFMFDTFQVANSGTINVSGGSRTTAFTTAPDAGDIMLFSEGILTNSAALTADGGSSAFSGGPGGAIILQSRTTTSVGNLSAAGGDGGTLLPGSMGGDGGFIEIFSTESLSGLSGVFSVPGGSAEPIVGDGFNGLIIIDGINRTGTTGVLTLP